MKLYLKMFWESAKLNSEIPAHTTFTDLWLIILNLVLGIGFALGAVVRTFITHDLGVGFALLAAGAGFALLSLYVETRARIRSLPRVDGGDRP